MRGKRCAVHKPAHALVEEAVQLVLLELLDAPLVKLVQPLVKLCCASLLYAKAKELIMGLV